MSNEHTPRLGTETVKLKYYILSTDKENCES